MSNFKTTKNTVTGNEQIQFEGKLVSIASTPLANVNGTLYRPCSIEFADKNAEVQKVRAIMYESNYAYGVNEGDTYLCTATKTERSVLISVSHLKAGVNATEEMFGFGENNDYADAEAAMAEVEQEKF